MPGEKGDDDLRVNVWKGPLTGGGVGDLMMHVPIDCVRRTQSWEAVIGNPEHFRSASPSPSTAIAPGSIGPFHIFKRMKIGVQLGTVSDYFLMRS